MGIRGFIRDVLSIYLSILIIMSVISNSFDKTKLLLSAFLLLGFSIWFMLERFGIIGKID
jgi:hypothetical protein